jgi:hypothetical protein
MPALAAARSMRVCPAPCLAPAVITITSEPRSTSMSSEPSTVPGGTNNIPWFRSSTSAFTLVFAMSKRLICRATPRIIAA